MALALIGAGSVGLSLGLYTFYYKIPPSPYPEEVTKHIRKALYYEGAGNDPRSAIQWYLQALEEATTLGLDQTSDKMTGLKIKIGAVYENSGRMDSAIRVYSGLLNEVQGALRASNVEEERTRLLKRALGTSVKVGELAMQVPSHFTKAEPSFVWALESILKETARRKGDTSWLDTESTGGLYEAVANFYYSTNRPQLALPLFLKALESDTVQSCHTIALMNNIASSISSQSSSIQVQENAAVWATRARDLRVNPAAAAGRKCDFERCSALFNLGMIYEKMAKLVEARDCYNDAIRKSLALTSPEELELKTMATEAVARIDHRLN